MAADLGISSTQEGDNTGTKGEEGEGCKWHKGLTPVLTEVPG